MEMTRGMWEEAQKALNRDVFAAYIYLLVLTEETGRLWAAKQEAVVTVIDTRKSCMK